MMLNNSLKQGFTSDNIAGASPEILAALTAANSDQADPYGADKETKRIEAQLSEIFETETSVFLVSTGSAANSLCLSTLTPPWGSVLCHPDSHINNDECGAPEFYTGGAKLVPVKGENAKIAVADLKVKARDKIGDVHTVQPSTVSTTQATETGSIYTLEEITEIMHSKTQGSALTSTTTDCPPTR